MASVVVTGGSVMGVESCPPVITGISSVLPDTTLVVVEIPGDPRNTEELVEDELFTMDVENVLEFLELVLLVVEAPKDEVEVLLDEPVTVDDVPAPVRLPSVEREVLFDVIEDPEAWEEFGVRPELVTLRGEAVDVKDDVVPFLCVGLL
ncbi:MAG: hypothetical protein Q9165_005216 [Trypethelium subeluteriae]